MFDSTMNSSMSPRARSGASARSEARTAPRAGTGTGADPTPAATGPLSFVVSAVMPQTLGTASGIGNPPSVQPCRSKVCLSVDPGRRKYARGTDR
ncbi:hypothetical protein GCM10011583_12730 [Streptomyces camponoticapitis]|uniref:Uncharacterized protein n=1 Tax=Streptomyces camponoticapitis TaxID=1616125 RepID=A0ABQ2DZQ3_9ACTN|nr:hypothetical protein GCM10011583_12730 [Streptomyces camponoticapitis]